MWGRCSQKLDLDFWQALDVSYILKIFNMPFALLDIMSTKVNLHVIYLFFFFDITVNLVL